MTKDEAGFEVIEAKLAELYQFQWERIEKMGARSHHSDLIREEVCEAREILVRWLYCVEAKDRARQPRPG